MLHGGGPSVSPLHKLIAWPPPGSHCVSRRPPSSGPACAVRLGNTMPGDQRDGCNAWRRVLRRSGSMTHGRFRPQGGSALSFSSHRKFLHTRSKADETSIENVQANTVGEPFVQVPGSRACCGQVKTCTCGVHHSVSASGATCKGFPAGLDASLSLDCHTIATSREQQSQAA